MQVHIKAFHGEVYQVSITNHPLAKTAAKNVGFTGFLPGTGCTFIDQCGLSEAEKQSVVEFVKTWQKSNQEANHEATST